MASMSIKFAGGVSARDGATFACEMGCERDFTQSARKPAQSTEVACWVKNTTPQAIQLGVQLGVVNGLPAIGMGLYAALIAANRARYCVPAGEGTGSAAAPDRAVLSS